VGEEAVVRRFSLLLLLACACACTTLPDETYIYLYQTDCQGRFTHTYWYRAKVLRPLYGYERGFVSAYAKDIGDYDMIDVTFDDYPKLGRLPWGHYSVWIGGYCLDGTSMGDCVLVYSARVDELP